MPVLADMNIIVSDCAFSSTLNHNKSLDLFIIQEGRIQVITHFRKVFRSPEMHNYSELDN